MTDETPTPTPADLDPTLHDELGSEPANGTTQLSDDAREQLEADEQAKLEDGPGAVVDPAELREFVEELSDEQAAQLQAALEQRTPRDDAPSPDRDTPARVRAGLE